PKLYSVAKFPTKTSRAANDVNTAILIFQSYPNGRKTGSMALPANPIYEFSNWYPATSSSNSSSVNPSFICLSAIISSAFPKVLLGPCEPKNHKITDNAKIILPAPKIYETTFSYIFKNTFFNIGAL